MPRRLRNGVAGLTFHVINRGAKKARLFESARDYQLFETILAAALTREHVSLFAYCLMPNHWHFVVSPATDGALSRFMHWLTTTHARRWQIMHGSSGIGAVYQGRYKAIAVSEDHHFLGLCRYVERNALRASLVERAEDWPWCSLVRRRGQSSIPLAEWPVTIPSNWLEIVNTPQADVETYRIREAVGSGRPLGDPAWRQEISLRLGWADRRNRKPDPITGV